MGRESQIPTSRQAGNPGREARLAAHQLVRSLTEFIHKRFLVLLISAYVLATFCPQFGLWLRNVQFGQIDMLKEGKVTISLSLLMLAFLLFNAGLGIKGEELGTLLKRPYTIALGFLANLLVPIAIVFVLRESMNLWHNGDEVQNLLVGVALIIAMPIAGSSAAWSQNANGNLALSLGLVFLSTVLSPFTTPLVLQSFSSITSGDYSEDLIEIAKQGTHSFLLITVVVPSLLGIIAHFILKEKAAALKSHLKLINFVVLLLLNYSNASISLPQVFRVLDVDYLAFVLAAVTVLCLVAFAAGWLIAKGLKTDLSDKAALMFGLGMNNNGTGLVLASQSLADHPGIFLPIIFYTLAQQVIAAIVDKVFFKAQE